MSDELSLENANKINNFIFKNNSLKTICKNKNIDFNEFVACVAYQVKKEPALSKCSEQSVLDCCVKSAQIGLKIDANGYAYLTAFENKKTGVVNCNVIVGYRGYVSLIKANNPKVSSICSFVISNEDIEKQRLVMIEGDGKRLVYNRNPLQSENSLNENDIAGFLSIVYYKDGKYDYCFMTKDDVNRVRNDSNNYKYAKDIKNTIWYKHYVAMGKKTSFRQLIKWCDFSGIDKLNEIDNEDFEDKKQEPQTQKYTEQDVIDTIELIKNDSECERELFDFVNNIKQYSYIAENCSKNNLDILEAIAKTCYKYQKLDKEGRERIERNWFGAIIVEKKEDEQLQQSNENVPVDAQQEQKTFDVNTIADYIASQMKLENVEKIKTKLQELFDNNQIDKTQYDGLLNNVNVREKELKWEIREVAK